FSGQNVITINNKNTILHNPEVITSKPYIKIYGDSEVELIINDDTSKYDIDEYIEIDSELKECYKGNDLETFKCEFPLLVEGENNIYENGDVDKIEIIPRWCRL